jgi:hypothetical protein
LQHGTDDGTDPGDGRKGETARVTEIMAVDLLAVFEERSIKDVPMDQESATT